jgi:hypothetical protein
MNNFGDSAQLVDCLAGFGGNKKAPTLHITK